MDDYLSTRTQTARHQSAGLRTIVGAALAAFLLGVAAMWYLSGGALSLNGLFNVSREVAGPTDAATAQRERATSLGSEATVLNGPNGLDQRVAEMEQRLARLDVQAQAAEGSAARAEALLIAFATRRAIERGTSLGYLAEQLQMRFGVARPGAVRTVIEAARNPITLDQLLARLDGLEPRLAEAPESEGALDWLSREFGELFVVRREDAPSPAPEQRIERARLFLESGRIDAAVSEVRMMPGAAEASDWIADAERYANTQRALETLETAAVLEPRDLRDGSGQRVGLAVPLGG
jgi:hypothetical protein